MLATLLDKRRKADEKVAIAKEREREEARKKAMDPRQFKPAEPKSGAAIGLPFAPYVKGAAELPDTLLGKHLTDSVRTRLREEKRRDLARMSKRDRETVSKYKWGDGLISGINIKVVSNYEVKCTVREHMKKCGNYPDELRGDLAKGVIKWEGRGADGSWRPSMTDWVKAQ